MNCRIVPLTEDLIQALAPRIRQSDRNELLAANGRTDMGEAMRVGLAFSTSAFAGLADDLPICAFGVAPASILGRQGTPWMIGTPELPSHALPVLRLSRGVVANWRDQWPLLVNYVDARNTTSIRWLKWLGFCVMPAQPYGKLGMLFHRFEMRNAHV